MIGIPWVKLALFSGVLFSVYLSYNFFTGILDENKELKITNVLQTETIKARESQIEFEKDAAKIEQEARIETEEKLKTARQEEKKLITLFQEHNFDNLLQKKPGLIIKRVNAGTKRLFDNAANSINIDTTAGDQMPGSTGD